MPQTPMKINLLVAYESEDSSTIRLTPKTLGTMLGRVPPQRYQELLEAFKDELVFRSDRHATDILKQTNTFTTGFLTHMEP